MKFILVFCLILAFGSALIVSTNTTNKTSVIWPGPKKITLTQGVPNTIVNPCSINYRVEAIPSDYVKQIINTYLIDVFKCKKISPSHITLTIAVQNPNQMIPESTQHQKYSLIIRQKGKWELTAGYYAGFVRGFQTFSQLLEQKENSDQYFITGIPIVIDDEPEFRWRSLMIDTSRHYLSMDMIKHTIDGLMFNKMNVLHWHIVDQDSFPMVVPKRPYMSENGSLGRTYTPEDVKEIINYAKVRGIRVVPEADTPAHTQSWGRSDELNRTVIRCNDMYSGQLDPTLNLTYEAVTDVFQYINKTFIDNYVHFGGDEIWLNCFDKRPEVKEWMDAHDILDYQQLQIYYREKQKRIWRQITPKKKAIYWVLDSLNTPVEDDDVIQWWGPNAHVNILQGMKNEVIISYWNQVYLDIGVGTTTFDPYRNYLTWRDIYQYNPYVTNVNVIGGETCLWSELNDDHTLDQKIWIRASAMAERLWNWRINLNKQLVNIVERLVAQKNRMKKRGFKPSIVSVQLCERSPATCFS